MEEKFVISSDSHIVEPPDLFVDRMDAAKYGDRIPHLVHEDENDYWYSDHKRMGVLGSFRRIRRHALRAARRHQA